jgi:PadR family transcriptional regulator PadR
VDREGDRGGSRCGFPHVRTALAKTDIARAGYEARSMTEISPEWTAELKKGSVQLCLLALLATEEKYGFQILHELRERSDGFFDLKEGTLYPALRRLEERAFVESRWIERDSGMPRKYYRLTDRGRRALAEALAVWDRMAAGTSRVLEGAR